MYRILNPMNHNVSLVRNDKGEEVIVIGKGIAFGKKKGDLIAENQVEKIFRMKTEESRENFMALLKDVPLDFITVTYEIIDKLSKKYHYPIQEYLYVTLTDHIYCSYQALTQGRYKDSNLPDISAKYPVAFQIANEAFEIYRQKLADHFPEDEIIRIAYHFINAER
ncbi:transcription antiterminator LacT [Streptococcus pneumoniae]|nr:transcription antiterminator LacT [Streptococcus pneumoniae]